MRTLDSTELVNLCDFDGQVLMMVNTASACGYTYQYEQMQELYETYSAQGFTVLAFPSNNFMNQESKDECDIRDFLDTTYQITFPVFEKIMVVGLGMHPLYVYLTTQTAEELQGDIEWNFTKFLIDRTGVVTHRFAPNVDPDRADVTGAITTLLAQ
jgi:glutathione peroxidase